MLKLSKIIAGTMGWGKWGKAFSTSEMKSLISHCYDIGISTFDHADIYGGYTTEAEFGVAFSKLGVQRKSVQFISKCGIQYLSESRNNKVKHYNYSAAYIIWSVEQSLRNLKTDYLDLLLLHRPSPLMHPNIINEAVEKLKTEGKILDFGVSNFTPSEMNLINSICPIAYNQIEFSLTAFSAMQDGTLDYMMSKAIKPMAWSPLGEVFKSNTEQTNRIHSQLNVLSKKYNVSKSQLLLAWLIKHPSSITPIVGTTNATRLKQAAKALSIDIELEDWFLLLIASQGHKVP